MIDHLLDQLIQHHSVLFLFAKGKSTYIYYSAVFGSVRPGLSCEKNYCVKSLSFNFGPKMIENRYQIR